MGNESMKYPDSSKDPLVPSKGNSNQNVQKGNQQQDDADGKKQNKNTDTGMTSEHP